MFLIYELFFGLSRGEETFGFMLTLMEQLGLVPAMGQETE